ncbi:MAG: DUF5686 family protein, partial [Candidatus Zixiibacteriota bacterium]
MPTLVSRACLYRIVISLGILLIPFGISFGAVVKGTIYNHDTEEAVPFATVRVEGTGRSMLANEDGEYRLSLEEGAYDLKFSHIAYYSVRLTVNVFDSVVVQDVYLRPAVIELPGMRVYERAYDPAQQVIREAIAHKEEILARIKAYSCEAYCKLVLRDTTKDDSINIWLITESQVVSHWEYPDRYKEVINARKHASSWQEAKVLIGAGELLNFNANRMDLGDYSVVSPTARDALDHYNYYLIDTVYIDSQRVFKLEIEPKNNIDPLFVGTISIADSTFAVVGVDLGLNEGFDFQSLSNVRISQRYAKFEEEIWMPVEIRYAGIVNVDFPFVPIPNVMTYDYVIALHNYTFNTVHPKGTFDEYMFEVAEDADDIDSATWETGQLIPLTADEIRGYQRIDSITNVPEPLYKKIALIGLGALFIASGGNYDFFHFNRVEGVYLGAGVTFDKLVPRTKLRLKSGYAFSGKYWQHRYAFTYTLWRRRKLTVGAEYHDVIRHRPTIISRSDANPTLAAITNKTDPFDYYLEKGVHLSLSTKVVKHTKLTVAYQDYNQYSVSNNTEYSIFRETKKHRSNPSVVDGKLRSVSGRFVYDSRPRWKYKAEERIGYSPSYALLVLGIDVAAPKFIDNDFDFLRYYVWLYRRQRIPGLGISRLAVYAGASDKTLPPQKYFTVDFGAGVADRRTYFKTLDEKNFSGCRALSFYVYHDFGRRLFRRSGLPIIKDIPLSLCLHGGVFWTDFKGHPVQAGDENLRVAEKPYAEIGFSIGRITPFNFQVYFTWQLSDYATNRFSFTIG